MVRRLSVVGICGREVGYLFLVFFGRNVRNFLMEIDEVGIWRDNELK